MFASVTRSALQIAADRLPLGAYTRLSVNRAGIKIGHEVQRAPIERIAAAIYPGREIIWYSDDDITAADLSVVRPDYERMLTDVERGRIGGILIQKIDRLLRLSREFERVNAIIEKAGGMILSCDPMFNTRDDISKIIVKIMVMFAEMEIAFMKARQRAHKAHKAETGKYHGGQAAAGFVKAVHDPQTKEVLNSGQCGIAHDPIEAPLLYEAARQIIGGVQASTVLGKWYETDSPLTFSSASSLMDCLTAPRISGLREYKVLEEDGTERIESKKAEWDEIIPEAWRKLLIAMRQNGATGKRGAPQGSLLGGPDGVIACGGCGKNLRGHTGVRMNRAKEVIERQVRRYLCYVDPRLKQEGHCGKVSGMAAPIDAIVTAAVIERIRQTPGILERIAEDTDGAERLRVAYTARRDIGIELKALGIRKGIGEIGEEEWEGLRIGMNQRLASIQTVIDSHVTRQANIELPEDTADADVLNAWFEALQVTQQRLIIKAVGTRVTVAPAGKCNGPRFRPERVKVEFP